jgi:hypothetical protein
VSNHSQLHSHTSISSSDDASLENPLVEQRNTYGFLPKTEIVLNRLWHMFPVLRNRHLFHSSRTSLRCGIRRYSIVFRLGNCSSEEPCSPLKVNRRFGGTYRLYLQGRINRARYQRESRLQAERSVDFQRTIRRYIPEDSSLHNHRCENLKSYNKTLSG